MIGQRLLSIMLVLSLGLVTVAVAGERGYITLASTTSTEHSGLFDAIVPAFEARHDISVRVVAVGTGQALRIGCNGDADAVLVHAPEAERAFVARGCGVDRRAVMANDFVIVGPASDPAGLGQAGSAAEALERVAAAQVPFASRGDESGTHKKEQALWAQAGLAPQGDWYRALGAGMGAALNTAAAMNAYTLTDRATWISFGNRQNLAVVYDGDPALLNPYASIRVNPERHDVKADLARAWHDWLVSDEGQSAIGGYRLRGHQLFKPTAE